MNIISEYVTHRKDCPALGGYSWIAPRCTCDGAAYLAALTALADLAEDFDCSHKECCGSFQLVVSERIRALAEPQKEPKP